MYTLYLLYIKFNAIGCHITLVVTTIIVLCEYYKCAWMGDCFIREFAYCAILWWTCSKLMLSDDVIKVVGYRQYHNSHTVVRLWSTSSVYNAVWLVCWMISLQNATGMLWHSDTWILEVFQASYFCVLKYNAVNTNCNTCMHENFSTRTCNFRTCMHAVHAW